MKMREQIQVGVCIAICAALAASFGMVIRVALTADISLLFCITVIAASATGISAAVYATWLALQEFRDPPPWVVRLI